MPEPTSCSCDTCRGYCQRKPGFLAPGDAERIAAYLRMTKQQLFERYLIIELSYDKSISVLAPAAISQQPGSVIPASNEAPGRCVFHTREGLCAVHPVKPRECALAHHGLSDVEAQGIHESVGFSWQAEVFQGEIRDLLR